MTAQHAAGTRSPKVARKRRASTDVVPPVPQLSLPHLRLAEVSDTEPGVHLGGDVLKGAEVTHRAEAMGH